MSTPSLPWFRMYTDFLNDPKMISLAFEDQRHFIGILALKGDGALDQECEPELMDRIVAQRLWIDHSIIRDVKKRLIAAELIGDDWQPLAWNKRQMRSDADPTGAERQRRFRERQKQQSQQKSDSNALRNGAVTLPEEIRVDTDTDTDKDRNGVEAEEKVPCQAIIDSYNEICAKLPEVRLTTSKRRRTVNARITEDAKRRDLEWWNKYFDYVAGIPFLCGINDREWKADFDWITNESNMAKIIEGKYENE